MKRFISVLLSLAFVLSFIPPAFATNYAPGTYTGEGSGFGGKVTAAVTVSSDKITSCALTGDGETPAIGGAALPKLQEQVLAAGSSDIDGVAGATLTSNAVKEAVANALKPAELKPVTSSAPPQATNRSAEDAANILYDLGLFSGTGTNPDGTPNFDLDRTPTRAEAVTMLVRLLGKEEEAKAGVWDIPFEDVADWAKPYVGYAYANGLTTGTGKTTFGGENPVNAAQYLTFVLRALGYTSGTDFQWDKPWELSDQIGLTMGQYNAWTINFVRGNVATISEAALSTTGKQDGPALLSQLVASGAVAEKTANSYLYPISSITLSQSNMDIIIGDVKTITATILPNEAVEKEVTWTSSNSSIATVNNGKVKGVAKGQATITATAANGLTVSCSVSVTENADPEDSKKLTAESLQGVWYSVDETGEETEYIFSDHDITHASYYSGKSTFCRYETGTYQLKNNVLTYTVSGDNYEDYSGSGGKTYLQHGDNITSTIEILEFTGNSFSIMPFHKKSVFTKKTTSTVASKATATIQASSSELSSNEKNTIIDTMQDALKNQATAGESAQGALAYDGQLLLGSIGGMSYSKRLAAQEGMQKAELAIMTSCFLIKTDIEDLRTIFEKKSGAETLVKTLKNLEAVYDEICNMTPSTDHDQLMDMCELLTTAGDGLIELSDIILDEYLNK